MERQMGGGNSASGLARRLLNKNRNQRSVSPMSTSEIQAASASQPASTPAAAGDHGLTFQKFLSAINPLQYLPVVGTIYRAITGDVIPEGLRLAGSLVVSALLGGPIGLATSIAVTIAEKSTGVDPEKIVAAQFHAAPPAAVGRVDVPPAAASQLAFTPRQLAAYGVRSDASGNLKLGDVEGADVLNILESVRLGRATAAYAANQAMPLAVAARGG
jgi:hypothetical protein